MPRPIGFWLKLVDRLIDERFVETLESHGVTRRQWQLLNVLTATPTPLAELDAAVAPFLDDADGETSADHLGELVESGWVRQDLVDDRDTYAVTEHGAEAFGTLGGVVAAMRRQSAAGIDEAEYATTVSVLERMARNLGWTDLSP